MFEAPRKIEETLDSQHSYSLRSELRLQCNFNRDISQALSVVEERIKAFRSGFGQESKGKHKYAVTFRTKYKHRIPYQRRGQAKNEISTQQ